MKKFLTSKICRLTSWTVVIAMFIMILPLQAIANPYTPQQRMLRERAEYARKKILQAEKANQIKPTKQPDIQTLTSAQMKSLLGRGAYRNKYLVGAMPWHSTFRNVNLITGNLSLNATDIRVSPAKGAGLVLSRTYNSQDDNIGPFGRGWQHAYDIRMEEAGNNNADQTDFFGGKHVYKRDADGLYTPPAYKHDLMESDYKSVLTLGPSDINSDLQTGQDGTKKHYILMGTVRYCDYIEDRFGNRTNLVYDANNLLSTVTDPSGRVLTFTWTNYGTQASPIYRITEVEGPLQTVTYEYYTSSSDPDAGGEAYNLKAVHIDPSGLNRITTYKYTSMTGTQGTEYGLVRSISDPLGHTMQWTYSLDTYAVTTGALGISSITEPAGVDSNNNPRTYTWTISNVTYNYTYSNFWIMLGGKSLWVIFDNQLRKTQIRTGGFTHSQYAMREFSYDTSNNQLTATRRDDRMMIPQGGDSQYRVRKDIYTYGPHGHTLTHSIDGYSNQDTYTYFDETKYFQKASVTDMAGRTSTYEVGAADDSNPGNRGNVLWVRDARYSQTGRQFSYTYDQYGRKTSETNLNNVTTTFSYTDQWGNMTETVQDPGGLARTTSMVYDAAGKVTSKTDPMGMTSSIEYNTAGQLEEVSFPAPYAETICYNYGANGRTETVTDGRGTTTMSYENGSDRVASVSDPVTGTVSYKYLETGDPLSKTLPDGTVTTVQYQWEETPNPPYLTMLPQDNNFDKAVWMPYKTKISRAGLADQTTLTKVDRSGVLYYQQYDYKYDTNGNIIGYMSVNNENEYVTSADGYSRIVRDTLLYTITKWHWKNAQNQWQEKLIAENDYTYDTTGNRLTNTIALRDQTDATSARTETYGYDELYRLTSVNYGDNQTQGYTFDPMGNRTQKTDSLNPTENSTYNNANMLLTRNLNNYTNDANGNQLTGGGRENTWDSQNRLRQCVAGGVTTTYTYGSDGLRRSQTRNGVTTRFILDGDTVAQEWVDADSDGIIDPNETVTYFGNSFRRDDSTGSTRWYVKDGLGSVLAEAGDPDANNNPIKSTRKMDVYGLFRASSGTPTSNHRFVGNLGHTYDDTTSLIYMRARYMDPMTGTFVSEDPGMDGVNWYVYCVNNPINAVDSNGKQVTFVNVTFWIIGMTFALLACGNLRYARGLPPSAFFNSMRNGAWNMAAAYASMAVAFFGIASVGLNDPTIIAYVLAGTFLLLAVLQVLVAAEKIGQNTYAATAVTQCFIYSLILLGEMCGIGADA